MTDLRSLSDEELDRLIAASRAGPSLSEGLADVGRGAARGLTTVASGIAGLPGDLQDLGRLVGSAVAGRPIEPTTNLQMPNQASVRQAIEGWTGPIAPPKSGPGKLAETLTEFAPGAAFPGGPVRRAMNVVAPALGAEAGEAVTGGSALGRAGGALAGGVLGLRGLTPAATSPEAAKLASVLEARKIPLTAGQRTGNRLLQWFEETAADMPGSSGKAAEINLQQKRALAGAVMGHVGKPGMLASDEALFQARTDIGKGYDALSARNTLQADKQFITDLTGVATKYADRVIPSQRATGKQDIETIINDIVSEMRHYGDAMPGELYQATRSRLGKMADGLVDRDPQLADAINGIKRALDDNMMRSLSPDDAAAWKELNKQYRDLLAIEKAQKGAGSDKAKGFVSPTALENAVTQQGRRGYRPGDLAELANAAEGIMRPLPQSGTGPRSMIQGTASTLGAILGGGTGDAMGAMAGAMAPNVLARGLLSGPAQTYLGNRMMPTTNQELRRRLLAQALIAERTKQPSQQQGY